MADAGSTDIDGGYVARWAWLLPAGTSGLAFGPSSNASDPESELTVTSEVPAGSHLLTLSAEGEALYSAIVPKALALERQIFSRFSAAEIARFDAMLRQIDAILLEGAAAAAPS